MRHNTPHTTIQVINWSIDAAHGLRISYSKGLNTYYLDASPYRATTLLINCYIIDDRKVVNGRLYVKLFDKWIPFHIYAACTELSGVDALDLVLEHETIKAISGVIRYSTCNMFSNN